EFLKLDDTATTLSLGVVKEPAGLQMLDYPTYARCAALPIDVAPLQRQVFTGPHSRSERKGVQSEPLRSSRGDEKSPALLNAERLHLPPFHARQVHANAGILSQHLPAHSLSERGLEHRVGVF